MKSGGNGAGEAPSLILLCVNLSGNGICRWSVGNCQTRIPLMASASRRSMLLMSLNWRTPRPGLRLGTLAAIALLVVGAANAPGDWANWRGPAFNGSADTAGLPDQWGPGDGILWTAALPGPGSSTPAVWENHIFLTAADRATGEVLDMALDAASGTVLWQHGHGKNRRQGNNDFTSPSPVTDGRRVVFMFGTGELMAYDFQGQLLWRRDLVAEFGPLSWNFGYGGSPLLHEGRLYVQLMRRPTHRDAPPDKPLESFLLAMDPATGKNLWRHVREANAVGGVLRVLRDACAILRGGRCPHPHFGRQCVDSP